MWSEVLTGVASAIVSGLIAWAIAKTAARVEIRKLRETWAHEKETAIDAEFDDMVAAVSYFIGHNGPTSYQDAVKAVAVYRSKATGEMASVIDDLSKTITRTPNTGFVLQRLDEAVKIKRNGQN